MTTRIKNILRPDLRELKAYHVQPSPGMVKLDAMENPFPLPEELQREWLQLIKSVSLNRYPDADSENLRSMLLDRMELPDTFDLMLGNGSDELIQLLCMAVINAPQRKKGRPVVMAPEPGFAMYKILAIAAGLEYVGVPLQADSYDLDMPAMLQAIEQYQPELMFLAYPNNPTGNLFKISDLQELAEATSGLLIIDEAYHAFAKQSAIQELKEYDHVLVLRTLSKLGLAGIRLGVLGGTETWLNELNKLRLPYNINTLTQITAYFACQHYSVFLKQANEIKKQRESLLEKLEDMEGIQPFPSQANFILFQVPSSRADGVFDALKDSKVLIKNVNATHPLLQNCLRVTVGMEAENEIFLQALHAIME